MRLKKTPYFRDIGARKQRADAPLHSRNLVVRLGCGTIPCLMANLLDASRRWINS